MATWMCRQKRCLEPGRLPMEATGRCAKRMEGVLLSVLTLLVHDSSLRSRTLAGTAHG